MAASCVRAKVQTMQKQLVRFAWLTPLALHSLDAHAWGLLTHVYFAQWLVWTLPLLDPNLRRAVQRFPELVMAGACLPDLALVSPTFRHTHQWEQCQHLLNSAHSDEDRAIAIGYASHLYVDVVAHNHFVPAHEAKWLETSMLTHVCAEWAADAHLMPLIDFTPHQLLRRHRATLTTFLACGFRCQPWRAARALWKLEQADRLLRLVKLPQALYRTALLLDKRVFEHFVYYVSHTQSLLSHIERLLSGLQPLWEADPQIRDRTWLTRLRQQCLAHLETRHPQPIHPYGAGPLAQNRKEIWAMTAPMMAPAKTSLG
jgi:hypothetical protein